MNGAKKVIALILVVIAFGMLYLAYYSLRTAFKFMEVENLIGSQAVVFGSVIAIIIFALMLLGAGILICCAIYVRIVK